MNDRLLKIAAFGEVLFDVFDGTPFLGGASLNFAVHASRLGADTTLISAVGNDELGEMALKELRQYGLRTDHIAVLDSYSTGTVNVTLDEKKNATYTFSADCAYDHIPAADPKSELDLFYFGTLAQRSEESRSSLKKILASLKCTVFFDVNLRLDFFTEEILENSFLAADIVKMNEEEFPFLCKMFGIEETLAAFSRRFNIKMVLLTLGADGCRLYTEGKELYSPAFPVKVVSTVGAGDSFCAAFLYHMLSGDSLEVALEAGNRLASKVAGQTGAV